MTPRILESMFQYWFLLHLTKSLFTCTYYFQCFIFILMSLFNSVFSKWITNNICKLNKYDQQLGKTVWGTQYYSSTSFPEKTKINEPFVKQKQLGRCGHIEISLHNLDIKGSCSTFLFLLLSFIFFQCRTLHNFWGIFFTEQNSFNWLQI